MGQTVKMVKFDQTVKNGYWLQLVKKLFGYRTQPDNGKVLAGNHALLKQHMITPTRW